MQLEISIGGKNKGSQLKYLNIKRRAGPDKKKIKYSKKRFEFGRI